MTENSNAKREVTISTDKSEAHEVTVQQIYLRYMLLMIVVGSYNSKDTNGEYTELKEFVENPIPYLTDGKNADGTPANWGWYNADSAITVGQDDDQEQGALGVGMGIPHYTNLKIRFLSDVTQTGCIYLLEKGTLGNYYDENMQPALDDLKDVNSIINHGWLRDLNRHDEEVIVFAEEELTNMEVMLHGNIRDLNQKVSLVDENVDGSDDTYTYGNGQVGIYPKSSAYVRIPQGDASTYKVTVDAGEIGINENNELEAYDVVITLPLLIPQFDILGEVKFSNDEKKNIILTTT